jgi:hypothetical protein
MRGMPGRRILLSAIAITHLAANLFWTEIFEIVRFPDVGRDGFSAVQPDSNLRKKERNLKLRERLPLRRILPGGAGAALVGA